MGGWKPVDRLGRGGGLEAPHQRVDGAAGVEAVDLEVLAAGRAVALLVGVAEVGLQEGGEVGRVERVVDHVEAGEGVTVEHPLALLDEGPAARVGEGDGDGVAAHRGLLDERGGGDAEDHVRRGDEVVGGAVDPAARVDDDAGGQPLEGVLHELGLLGGVGLEPRVGPGEDVGLHARASHELVDRGDALVDEGAGALELRHREDDRPRGVESERRDRALLGGRGVEAREAIERREARDEHVVGGHPPALDEGDPPDRVVDEEGVRARERVPARREVGPVVVHRGGDDAGVPVEARDELPPDAIAGVDARHDDPRAGGEVRNRLLDGLDEDAIAALDVDLGARVGRAVAAPDQDVLEAALAGLVDQGKDRLAAPRVLAQKREKGSLDVHYLALLRAETYPQNAATADVFDCTDSSDRPSTCDKTTGFLNTNKGYSSSDRSHFSSPLAYAMISFICVALLALLGQKTAIS